MTGDTLSNTPFLVTGLPRTRSAWLAAVLSDDNVRYCHHEPVGRFQSYEHFRDWLITPSSAHIGAADHAIGFIAAKLLRDIQPRILLVERPFGDVVQSFERYMDGINIDLMASIGFMTRLQVCLAELRGPLVYRIKYSDLNNAARLKTALRWLVPGIDLDGLETAMKINVQADRAAVLSRGAPNLWYLQ